jgi:hypothetical protein
MIKAMSNTERTYRNKSKMPQLVIGLGVIEPGKTVVVGGELNNRNFEEVVDKAKKPNGTSS